MTRVVVGYSVMLVLTFLFLVLVITSAFALDFSQEIKGADDKPMIAEGKPVTVGQMVAGALFAALPGDEKLTGQEKFARAELALKVRSGGDVQLAAEDISLIKKVVAQAYGPLIVHRIWEALDPGVKPNKVQTETIPAPEGGNGGGN